jgi:hypothetical protein
MWIRRLSGARSVLADISPEFLQWRDIPLSESEAILPAVDYAKIDEQFRPAVREVIERVLNSAFRESSISVVDHCRAALTVLLSRWLVQYGHEDVKTLGTDLGELAKKTEKQAKDCVAKAAQIVARLHVRGKPNERHAKGLRAPLEEDAEFCMHALGLAIRDFGWAAAPTTGLSQVGA